MWLELERNGGVTGLRERLDAGDLRGALAVVEDATRETDRADPRMRSALLILRGRLRDAAGDPAAAEDDLSEAARLASGVPGSAGLRVQAFAGIAALCRAAGRLTEARDRAREALEIVAGESLQASASEALALVEAGRAAVELDDPTQALAALQRAVVVADRLPPGRDRDDARVAALQGRAHAHRLSGDLRAAHDDLLRAVEIAEQACGARSIELANVLNDLGMLGKFSGAFDESAEHLQRALAIIEHIGGPTHPDAGAVLHNLGGLAHARGAYEAGEPWARRAVEIHEQALGPDHLATVLDCIALAAILHARGAADEAERLLTDSVPRLERLLGPDHHEVAVAANNLATMAQGRGDHDAAETWYRRAIAIKERRGEAESPSMAISLNNLGTLLRAAGRLDDARDLYTRALAILERAVADDHPNLRAVRRNLERVESMAGTSTSPDSIRT